MLHVDRAAGVTFRLPPSWEASADFDGRAHYAVARPRQRGTAHVLVVRAEAPDGATASDLLAERERELGGRVEIEWREDMVWRCDDDLTPGYRCLVNTEYGRYVIEETAVIVGSDVILMQAQVPEGCSDAERNEIDIVQNGIRIAEPYRAGPREEISERRPNWEVLCRSIGVYVDVPPRRVAVDYACRIRNVSSDPIRKISWVLLPPPLSLLRSVQLDRVERSSDLVVRDGHMFLEISVPARGEVELRIRYDLLFERINAWAGQARDLFMDRHGISCLSPAWLPRLKLSPDSSNRGTEAKATFRIDVDAPSSFHVHASAPILEEIEADARRSVTYDSGKLGFPFIQWAARNGPESHVRSHGVDVRVAGPVSFGDAEQLAHIVGQGMQELTAWLGQALPALRLDLLFYDGDECRGLGPLLLIGRAYRSRIRDLDHPLAGTLTLREIALHELAHLWFGGSVTVAGGEQRDVHETCANYLMLRVLERTGQERRAGRLLDRMRRMASSGHLAMTRALAWHEQDVDRHLANAFRRYRGCTVRSADLEKMGLPLWFQAPT